MFIYELLPRSDRMIFEDGMLNVFLYNRVGKTKYQQLRQFYASFRRRGRKEITRPFNHAFASFQPSEWKMTPDMEEAMKLPEDYETASVGQAPSYTVTEEVFDFELFMAGLSETMIPRKSITQDVRESIKSFHIYTE